MTFLQHLLSLATRTNADPLPPISETYGVRLPPLKHCLTAVDFDLVPNKPPPEDVVKYEDEEEEEESEEEEEDVASPTRPDEEMELAEPTSMADVQPGSDLSGLASGIRMSEEAADGDPLAVPNEEEEEEAGSDDDDGLFGDDGADDDDDDDDMEMVDIQATATPAAAPTTNGTSQVGEKRKMSEDDEYD